MPGEMQREIVGACQEISRVCSLCPFNFKDSMIKVSLRDDTNKKCINTATWTRIAEIANENSFLMNYANFWGYPDPDMLEVGNGNLTLPENRAHFALWAMMKAPLIIGTPV